MKKRDRYKANHKKEKAIMLASSLFVLSALTMTGFYVKEKNQDDNDDGYVVDFGQLENQADKKAEDIANAAVEDTQSGLSKELQAVDDLDYDPVYREANSSHVTNEKTEEEKKKETEMQQLHETEGTAGETADEKKDSQDDAQEMSQDEKAVETSAAVSKKQFSFDESETLQWPIAGNVLLNYSMDKTIYFPTLQQYKYNPAIVIEAAEGAMITAAADGKVSAVYEDAEIGHAVDISLGDGYKLTYGQLKDIPLMEGDIVEAGDIVGYVGTPSKYYSAEGSNVYFKLTKDDVPVNPLEKLE